MAADDFIVINEGGRPPTPSRNSRIPPPPPNHHRPPQGGGGIPPPRIVNTAPHPANFQQQLQRQAPSHPQQPLPPQHPLVIQHDPPVRISDIRKERLTPDEAREELSEYLIYRFEPSQRSRDYDDGEGQDRGPNWESVLVVEVRGVSKKEAARQVRHLNQTTWSLGEKKSTLSGAQQRQIEKVLEELQARDHRYFQTHLVQINHQLRTKINAKKHDRHHHHHHHKHGSKHTKDISLFFRDHKHPHHKRSSSSKKKNKSLPPQERISLTAYYKRSPKPEMNALAIYHQRDAAFRRWQNPPPPAPIMADHHHPAEGGGHNMRPGGAVWHGNSNGQGGNRNNPIAAGELDPDDHRGRRRGGGRSSSRTPPPPGSPYARSSSSDGSLFSETFSMDDDMTTTTTTTTTPTSDNSSQDSRRVRGGGSFHRHRPHRKDRQYRVEEGPRHFGIRQPHNHHHHHRGHHRIADEFFSPVAPPPPPPPPPLTQIVQPVVDMEQIEQMKSHAYEAGRADERSDVERIAEKIAVATVSAVQPPPPPSPRPRPPRHLQRRPSIRLVHPGDISHEEATLERLERLDLRDEALQEARYILAPSGPGGRRRRNYYSPRGNDEGMWEGKEEEEEQHHHHHHFSPTTTRRPLDDAMDHIRRSEHAAYNIRYMHNPFAPLPYDDERERRRRGRGPSLSPPDHPSFTE